MSRRDVLSGLTASTATSLRTAVWRSGFCLLGALLLFASACGYQSSGSQRSSRSRRFARASIAGTKETWSTGAQPR